MKRFYELKQEWIPGVNTNDLVYCDADKCPRGYTANVFDLLPEGHPKKPVKKK